MMTQVVAGDRIRIHGRVVGDAERFGEVLELRGELLVVRFDDGHQAVLAPGSDCEITHAG
ncbi:DUF1918 domain-containing protein [Microbacterium sp. ASV81]|uniref:DUF1918 domain-containing protein n=1 Tax=Microbacterium capsulatum TaxID=3041921 RepID=A0ABU0XIH5_9MICO|nr:DUF1918 domain-containing protein [Microbacterium sp. ASV81]MDQ4214368.1 DUF1918 domain-containing protein [Microbacterium sp. ASV81]